MLSARRVTLDAVLIEAAAAAGAEVRTQTAVTGLIEDRGRVVGLETKSGELRAPLVVGADGVPRPWLAWSAPRNTTRRLRAGSSPGPTSKAPRQSTATCGWTQSGTTASSRSPPTPVCSWPPSSRRSNAERRSERRRALRRAPGSPGPAPQGVPGERVSPRAQCCAERESKPFPKPVSAFLITSLLVSLNTPSDSVQGAAHTRGTNLVRAMTLVTCCGLQN